VKNFIGKVSEVYRPGTGLSTAFFQELPKMDKPLFMNVLGLKLVQIREVFLKIHT
jgi:hypothetical protein